MSQDKIEVVPHQDAVTLEADEDGIALSQVNSSGGYDSRIYVCGKGNVDALITALLTAREGMA